MSNATNDTQGALGRIEQAEALHARTSDAAVQWVPIEDVHESPWNPRQIYAEGPLEELAESMRATGFRAWRPIIARPFAAGGVEVGAGHRRLRAARRAGLSQVPCIVTEMSDDAFRDVLNFDNDGAEAVHPLHAAAGWRAHMQHSGVGVIDIANRIGKSKEYVYQLLQLFNLTEQAQRAFLEGAFTKQHAVVIARHTPNAQTSALKWLATQAHLPGHRDLDAWFRGKLYEDLNVAPFALADATLLVGAGACLACPKRACNVPGYEAPEHDTTDACMDGECYDQKVDNHLIQLERDAEERDETAVRLSDLQFTTSKSGALSARAWHDAAPADPLAKTGIVWESNLPGRVGKVFPVVLLADLRAAQDAKSVETAQEPAFVPPMNAAEKAVRARYESDEEDEEERKARYAREDAEAEQAEHVERTRRDTELRVRHAILNAALPRVGGLMRGDMEALAVMLVPYCDDIEFVAEAHGIVHDDDLQVTEDAVLALIPTMAEADLFALLLRLIVNEDFSTRRLDREPTALLALAKRYKVDAAKIREAIENPAPAPKPKADARKAVIGKLPAMGASKAKAKPAKKAAGKKAAPVKKPAPAKKAPANKSAKGGKK